MSYARLASPHGRPKPITRRPIPQVSLGLDSRGWSTVRLAHIRPVQRQGAGHLHHLKQRYITGVQC